MEHGQKIKLSEMGDEAPGMLPGDIIFVLQEKEHPVFKRKRSDLLLQKRITLVEALCGLEVRARSGASRAHARC